MTWRDVLALFGPFGVAALAAWWAIGQSADDGARGILFTIFAVLIGASIVMTTLSITRTPPGRDENDDDAG